MWLLNTSNLQLEAFPGEMTELYTILSHTWGADEVTFQDMRCPNQITMQKSGYKKVKNFCDWAHGRAIAYAWIDTCCIDKSSSAELSEAINSMFTWYHDAISCVVYLSDVPAVEQTHPSSIDVQKKKFVSSRWFTRGFTLQELIAPERRVFLADDWSPIDDSLWGEDILDVVSKITNIKSNTLRHRDELWNTCNAERMSWAAHRQTTRPEDRAYSLMGIFHVNMAILYGEGLTSAFQRLQYEIMRISFDQTLFAWRSRQERTGLLASSPSSFGDTPALGLWAPNMLAPMTVTNIGILIRPCIFQSSSAHIIKAALQCDVLTCQGWMCLLLFLERVHGASCVVSGKSRKAYRRVRCDRWYAISSHELDSHNIYDDILVLEDNNYNLVAEAQRQHDARWSRDSKDAFGTNPMMLEIGKET